MIGKMRGEFRVEPWFYIVALGAAITGFAWMMPKSGDAGPKQEFVSEESYNPLLEDLEAENRELLDAIAKFKREHDGTIETLGSRIVELEQQMKSLTEQSRLPAAPADYPPSASPLATTPARSTSTSNPAEVPSVVDAVAPAIAAYAADAAPESSAFPETELPPATIRGRYAELLDMHEKGKSVEQIAKATGMNKGEVQLILQLARQEERHA